MNSNRISVLKKVVPRWKVDIENGVVYTRNGACKNKDKKGYLQVITRYEGKNVAFKVHEIIAYVGGLNVLDNTINHKDGNKQNNRIENLEAISNADNLRHASKTGLIDNRGSKCYQSKLSESQVIEIKQRLENKENQTRIAEDFNVSVQLITDIKKGRAWSHI